MDLTTILLIIAGLAIAFGTGWWLGRRRGALLETELAVLGAQLRSEEALDLERTATLERAMGHVWSYPLEGQFLEALILAQAIERLGHVRRGVEQRAIEVEQNAAQALAGAHAAGAVAGRRK